MYKGKQLNYVYKQKFVVHILVTKVVEILHHVDPVLNSPENETETVGELCVHANIYILIVVSSPFPIPYSSPSPLFQGD